MLACPKCSTCAQHAGRLRPRAAGGRRQRPAGRSSMVQGVPGRTHLEVQEMSVCDVEDGILPALAERYAGGLVGVAVQGRPDARNQAVKNYKRLHFARWVPLQGWEQRGSSSQHKRSPHRRPRRGRSCWAPDVGPPLNPRHPVAVAWCPARSQEFGPIRNMPGWPSGIPVECQPELPRLHPRPLECVESIYIGFAAQEGGKGGGLLRRSAKAKHGFNCCLINSIHSAHHG